MKNDGPLRYEIIDRWKTVGIILPGEEHYTSTCQIVPYGDMALMNTINGPHFYELMAVQGRELMEELKIQRLEGFVTDEHLRLMKFKLRRIGDVSVARRGMMRGEEMNWAVVQPLMRKG